MGYINQRIHVFKKLTKDEWSSTTSLWDSTGEVLTEAQLVNVNIGLGKQKDKFTVTMLNPDNKLFRTHYNGDDSTTVFTLSHYPIPTLVQSDDTKFSVWVDGIKKNSGEYTIDNGAGTITFNTAPATGTRNIQVRFNTLDHGDTVRIYQWRDAQWSSLTDSQKQDALLIEGVISNVTSLRNDSGKTITITGKNWIEMMLDTLIPISATGNKCYEVIGTLVAPNSVLNTIKVYNPNRSIVWDPDNPSTKSDGSAFPNIEYASTYKTALEMIEDLSSDEYTNDGQYIWYIWTATYNDGTHTAGTKYLKWQAKTATSSLSLVEGTDDIHEVTINKKVDNVVNAIIYYIGKDAYEHSVHDLNFDPVSMGKNGAKWKYITKTKDLLRGLLVYEKENGGTTPWPNGRSTVSNFPAAYPYTWAIDSTVSSTNDADFNSDLINLGKTIGKKITQQIIDQFKDARHSVKLLIRKSAAGTYTVGEVATLTFPTYNLDAKKLRLMSINHRKWDTELKYEEDEKLLIA